MRQPETVCIVNPFRDFMVSKGWYVKKMHGNVFQAGFPDLYCHHKVLGYRLVECKYQYIKFTKAQVAEFPKMISAGEKIWVIHGDDFRAPHGVGSMLQNYSKLFNPPNCEALMLEYRLRGF